MSLTFTHRIGLGIGLILSLLATTPAAETKAPEASSPRHLLAAETAAETRPDSFFSGEGRRTYSTQAIAAALLPATDPLRHVVWGGTNTRVELYFFNADPHEQYELELTFLSDTPDRVLTVTTFPNRLLEEKIALPNGQPLTRRWALPPESYKSGRIYVEVRPTAGPDAPVCALKLFCRNPQTRPPVPDPPPPARTVAAGRLTPRPANVQGLQTTSITLAGTWRFNPAVEGEFWNDAGAVPSRWQPIEVPGQWSMQGFTVEAGKTAGYQREFTLPADWADQRVKLRFDGVYAEARVWLNGREAGTHSGGATPFELDITRLVRNDRPNHLALSVRSSGTKADSLAVGNLYAGLDLGGITRKVTLFAVPQVNIAALDVTTTFDKTYTNAQLTLDVEIANESTRNLNAAALRFTLHDPSGALVDLTPPQLELGKLTPGATLRKSLSIPIPSPRKWDCEHPNLYRLTCELSADNQPLQSVSRRVGFRQVEIRGKQVLVNGLPVKLHGASHHEAHPSGCRVQNPAYWRRDAELFRECNMNYLRTSHYPPPEEFLDACDEVGLFVACEGPMCFAGGTPLEPDEVPTFVTLSLLEMVKFHRNHPSVIFWSLANESNHWRDYFQPAAEALKAADPTRPRTLSGTPNVGTDDGRLEYASPHYPGLQGTTLYAHETRPTLFDEFMHLNCYNREEMVTDPGLRDIWGLGVTEMWERTYASPDIFGGSIWSGIDEMFYAPGGKTFGFGPWGIIDGWRRPKPEFWHVKKYFSPIHIAAQHMPLPANGAPLQIPLQNRFNFSNLSEVRFNWTLGGQSGTVNASAAPHTTGTLLIPVRRWDQAENELQLKAFDPKGNLIDAWQFQVGASPQRLPAQAHASTELRLVKTPDLISIHAGGFVWNIDAKTGLLRAATTQSGAPLLTGGPHLMLLPLAPPPPFGNLSGTATYEPLTTPCTGWRASAVRTTDAPGTITVEVDGSYNEAHGTFSMRFAPNGHLVLNYRFTAQKVLEPRQIGVVFDLPRNFDQLSWRRRAPWSVYPDDHIGRPVGTAKAFPHGVNAEGLATPRTQPDWPWSQDANELGSNDFRSTKMNILTAALHANNGLAFSIASAGSQHVRAWVAGDRIHCLIADYTNEGSAGFFIEHVIPPHPLRPGTPITAQISLALQKE